MYVDEMQFRADIARYQVAGSDDADRIRDEIISAYLVPMTERVVGTYYGDCCPDVQADLVQEALILAVRVLDTYTPERGRAFAYLTQAIRNRATDAIRKESSWAKKKARLIERASDKTLPGRFIGASS